MGANKKELYRLIDALPTDEVEVAKRFLEFLIAQDPTIKVFISAPYDDEPVSEKEDAEAKEAWEDHLKGASISHDDAAREGSFRQLNFPTSSERYKKN